MESEQVKRQGRKIKGALGEIVRVDGTKQDVSKQERAEDAQLAKTAKATKP